MHTSKMYNTVYVGEFTFSHLIRNSSEERSRFNCVSNTAAVVKMDVKNVTSLLRSSKLYFQRIYRVVTMYSFIRESSQQFKLNVTLISMTRLTPCNLMWKILFPVKLSNFIAFFHLSFEILNCYRFYFNQNKKQKLHARRQNVLPRSKNLTS